MTTFYCIQCWSEVPETAAVCPHCGDDIASRLARADYADKLIAALHHPEPTTPVRAAWVLGERQERKAVDELCRLVRRSADAFAIASAVEALGKIGDRQALETVRWAANHPSPLVRPKAERALHRLSAEEGTKQEAGKP
jgi:HEAT repeat protein